MFVSKKKLLRKLYLMSDMIRDEYNTNKSRIVTLENIKYPETKLREHRDKQNVMLGRYQAVNWMIYVLEGKESLVMKR